MALQESSNYKYEDKYTVKLGKYRFRMRPEEKRSLKKRLESDPEFAKVVLESMANDDLFAALEYSVRFKSNAIMQIYGIPESGKSTIAKILVYHLVQMLKKQGQNPDVRLTYNYADTIHENELD